jgi:hypothetical protein
MDVPVIDISSADSYQPTPGSGLLQEKLNLSGLPRKNPKNIDG